MYRRYEDPFRIERMLESAEIAMARAIASGDEDAQIALSEEINDLQQRLAAAWEDDEAEVYGHE